MANKYNTKKKYCILGNYLKTSLEGERKETRRYSNTVNTWQEVDERKKVLEKNEDFLKSCYFGDKKRAFLALRNTNGENGAEINCKDKNGNNGLILAVYSRKEEVIKMLVNYNKDEKGRIFEDIEPIKLNELNNDRISALHLAVKLKNLKIAKVLLQAGANPNVVGKYGETPIFDSVREDDREMIELLLSYGAKLNVKNREGHTPLIVASQNRNRQEALLCLIKNGADIYETDKNLRTPLMHAANNDNGAMMDIILKATKYDKDYMNNVDINGVSTLIICAKRGNREAVRVLLSRGVNPFGLDKKGKSAADYASYNNHHTCFEIIEKAKRIHIFAESMETTQDNKQKYLLQELEKIGKQNRVQNSCMK